MSESIETQIPQTGHPGSPSGAVKESRKVVNQRLLKEGHRHKNSGLCVPMPSNVFPGEWQILPRHSDRIRNAFSEYERDLRRDPRTKEIMRNLDFDPKTDNLVGKPAKILNRKLAILFVVKFHADGDFIGWDERGRDKTYTAEEMNEFDTETCRKFVERHWFPELSLDLENDPAEGDFDNNLMRYLIDAADTVAKEDNSRIAEALEEVARTGKPYTISRSAQLDYSA